jgi:hypothetical protein
MKEPYIEGLANHNGPELGAGVRGGTCEAMIGVRTGGILCRENLSIQGADVVTLCGRQHGHAQHSESCPTLRGQRPPACVETPCVRTESLRLSSSDETEERVEKNELRKTAMNGCRQSDSPILATKPPNNVWDGQGTAEVVERRGLTKGKAEQ